MINTTKKDCSNNQFNQQIENINIELESLNENVGALIFQMSPPIVKELNTVHNFNVKGIITSKTTYSPVYNVTGDTWTGTIAFNTTTKEDNSLSLVLDGNEVIGLIIENED
jgi:hypothetical protein